VVSQSSVTSGKLYVFFRLDGTTDFGSQLINARAQTGLPACLGIRQLRLKKDSDRWSGYSLSSARSARMGVYLSRSPLSPIRISPRHSVHAWDSKLRPASFATPM